MRSPWPPLLRRAAARTRPPISSSCRRGSGPGDPKNPEAEALAVRGGRIVADRARTRRSRRSKGPKTVVLDGKWRRVVPGFIDCHTHMTSGGFDLLALDLRNSKSPADFTREVAAYAKTKPAGQWLTDGTWDHTQWTPPELPTKADARSGAPATVRPASRASTATWCSATAWR